MRARQNLDGSPPLRLAVVVAAVWILLLSCGSGIATALDFPQLSGRVVDVADVIDAETEQAIETRLAAHEQKSSDQLVVATIPSLQGENLEDYANRLFRHWQLGQADRDNGVLLLVAIAERKIRIEVGYGLEPVLTDALSRLIIENSIIPAFKAGDYAAGLDKGVSDILTVLQGDAAALEDRARPTWNTPGPDSIAVLATVFFILVFSIILLAILFTVLAPVFGEKLGKNRYKWLGTTIAYGENAGHSGGRGSNRRKSGWFSGSSSGGFSGGGFSGGGGSSGGGGASGGW